MQTNLRDKNFKYMWAESHRMCVCVCVCVRMHVISRVRILKMCGRNRADGVWVHMCIISRVRILNICGRKGRWCVCVCVCVCACVWALTHCCNLTCDKTVVWQVFSCDKLCQLNSLLLNFYILHIRMTKIKSKLKLG
jgi:hypothetical protein